MKNKQYAVMSHPMQITIFIGSCVIQQPVKRPSEKKKKAIAQTRFMNFDSFLIYIILENNVSCMRNSDFVMVANWSLSVYDKK